MPAGGLKHRAAGLPSRSSKKLAPGLRHFPALEGAQTGSQPLARLARGAGRWRGRLGVSELERRAGELFAEASGGVRVRSPVWCALLGTLVFRTAPPQMSRRSWRY